MWIFFSVVVICITIIAWKYIDEACSTDLWHIEKKFTVIEKNLYEIKESLRGGAEWNK